MMKHRKHFFAAMLFAITSIVFAREPLDTQYTTGGLETHLLKVTVSNGVMTIAFMVENPSEDESVSLSPTFNPNEIEYVAGEKRYPVLKDANDQWMLSPFGKDELFSEHSGSYQSFRKRGKIVGWVKFEAPADDAWPIDLTLPQTSPFTIEKPN